MLDDQFGWLGIRVRVSISYTIKSQL